LSAHSIHPVKRRPLNLMFLLLLAATTAFADDVAEIKPQLHMVPMRDGTKLATDVYLPSEGKPPFPVIFARGPYGKGGLKRHGQRYCRQGYALVAQDIRGRHQSEGHHAIIFHHGGWAKNRDGHDSLLWIAEQPWCNGRVATIGGSALGITQNMLAPDAPDVLCGQIPFVAFSNMYNQAAYQGGVWRKSLLEGWLTATGMVDVNLETFRAHPNYDEFWAELNPEAQAHRANAPAAFVGGWYDIFLQGTINAYVALQNNGGPKARGNCKLVIGPIAHGPFTELKYPPNANMQLGDFNTRLLEYWLKGKQNGITQQKPVRYYVMGDPTDEQAPGNYWREVNVWPPPSRNEPFYFHADGRLASGEPPSEAAMLTYRYDPRNPVPTVGGQNLRLPKGPMDQRKVESRSDVLLFTSETLAEPVEVTGRIIANLFISSDCPDTDFTVKLSDVYPDGRSMLVTDGILRARFRKSFEHHQLLEPGQVCPLAVDLWSTSLVFNRGHRIRIAVSSSNAPRFEPNPNTGGNQMSDEEARIATNNLHFSATHPSHIVLPVYDEAAETR